MNPTDLVFLCQVLDVDPQRLEVDCPSGYTTLVDVSILPEQQMSMHDSSIDQVLFKVFFYDHEHLFILSCTV